MFINIFARSSTSDKEQDEKNRRSNPVTTRKNTRRRKVNVNKAKQITLIVSNQMLNQIYQISHPIYGQLVFLHQMRFKGN